MGRVPQYQDQVAPGAIPGVRQPGGATAASFGGQEAADLQQFGQITQRAGQQVLSFGQQLEEKEISNEAREADLRFREQADQAEAQFLQRTGHDAANVDKDFRDRLDEIRKNISKGMKSPVARDRFSLVAQGHYPGYVRRMLGHRVREANKVTALQRQESKQRSKNAILKNPWNDDAFDANAQKFLTDVRADLAQAGVAKDKAIRETAFRDAMGELHQLRVGALLRSVTPERPDGIPAAEAHLSKYAQDMAPAVKEALEKKVMTARMGWDAQRVTRQAMFDKDLTDAQRLKLAEGEAAQKYAPDILSQGEEFNETLRLEMQRAIQKREQVKDARNTEQFSNANEVLFSKIRRNKEGNIVGFPSAADVAYYAAATDMDSATQSKYFRYWDAAVGHWQKGQYNQFTNSQYARLSDLALLNPTGFSQMNLVELRPLLKPADYDRLIDLQSKIRNGETNSPRDRTYREARQALYNRIKSLDEITGESNKETRSKLLQQKKANADRYLWEQIYAAPKDFEQKNPADRSKFVQGLVRDAFNKYDLNDNYFTPDTTARKIDLAMQHKDNPSIGEVQILSEELEAFEKASGVPADAPRVIDQHGNVGSIHVTDRDAIENILEKNGAEIPFTAADGRDLKGIIITMQSGRMQIKRIHPVYEEAKTFTDPVEDIDAGGGGVFSRPEDITPDVRDFQRRVQ